MIALIKSYATYYYNLCYSSVIFADKRMAMLSGIGGGANF